MIENEIIPPTTNIPNNEGEDINEEDMLNEFKDLFQPGRAFATRALLRSEINRYGLKYNVVMSTKNSNYRSVHLWCKHAGIYKQGKRQSKKATPEKVIKPRNKITKRSGCGCFIKAKLINEMWIIEHSHGEHNHTIPKNRAVYSIHRRQSEEIKSLILQLLNDGQKISNILEYLNMIGINNIIKKDIENLQQQYRRKEKKQQLRLQQQAKVEGEESQLQQQHQQQPTFDPLLYHNQIIHYTNTNTPSSILKDTDSLNDSIV